MQKEDQNGQSKTTWATRTDVKHIVGLVERAFLLASKHSYVFRSIVQPHNVMDVEVGRSSCLHSLFDQPHA